MHMQAIFKKIFGCDILILCGLWCLSVGEASSTELANWRFFEASDGLGESWSSFVTAGPSGKVWVSHAGVDKLSWLDGWPAPVNMLVHTIPSPGLDLKVHESRSGQLWSLYSNGVQLFRDGQWVKYEMEEISNPYPAEMIRTLIPFLPGEQDQLFYLLTDRLMLFNAATEQTKVIKKAGEGKLGRFIDMIAARDGGIWITGENGVAKLASGFGPVAGRWSEYLSGKPGVKDFRAPVEGADGELYVTAVNFRNNKRELVHFDGAKWQILSGYEGNIIAGWPGLDDSYWIMKEDNTISLVQNGTEKIQEKKGILAGDLNDVTVEPDGVFWLATSHGIARYAPSIWRTPVNVKEIKNRIHVIHEDREGRLWFGGGSRLLLYQLGQWKVYRLPAGLETHYFLTQSICSLPDGRLAILTLPYNDFLLAFDPDKERFERISYLSAKDSAGGSTSRTISLIAPRSDGKLWVFTSSKANSLSYRLEVFDGTSFRPYLDLGSGWNIGKPRYIFEAANGDLWIGGQSQDGLALYKDGQYRTFGDDEGYAGGCGFCIFETKEGEIWVGGRNEISRFDGQNWQTIMSGLSGVRSITTSRDGTVWIACGSGLFRLFGPSELKNTEEDGLPNTATYSVVEDSRGQIWVGTISGLSLYHPEADTDPPETFVPEKENLKETPPAGEVRLIFSGVDRWKQTRPNRLLFSHRLDGGEWSSFKTGNMAVFNKLPSGEHFFEVRAMDVNLNYDPQPAVFGFTVLLPWYKESGFQVVVGIGSMVIIFLLGYAVYRHVALEKLVVKRTDDLHQANLQLKQNVTELENASRLASIGVLAGSITHEINRPINAVKIIVDTMILEFKRNKEILMEELAENLETISNQISRVGEVITNVRAFWTSPADKTEESFDLKESVNQALSLLERQISSHGIALDVAMESAPFLVNGNRIHLEQIVINLVVNSVQAFDKSEQTDKKINISVRRSDDTAILEVGDNGIGFPESDLGKLFDPFFSTKMPGKGTGLGLAIVKSYIEGLGGTIGAGNKQMGGALFLVKLPISRSNRGTGNANTTC